ncbi:hypothetical protein MLD38_003303 [Melastoma candidum]|uniref:Uncharacterized protein n=1 Tax=Melastoma candidum TaxID=119954 RepID=A0ACB9S2D9_9MYRT|nr:hypothetical protein MLD38_003303 [Melastoma candidum]
MRNFPRKAAMETGSTSKPAKKHPEMERGREREREGERERVGDGSASALRIERFVPRTDHNPRELRSWAKRTGFVSNFSGESNVSGTAATDRVDGGTRFGVQGGRGGGSSLARQGNDGGVVGGSRVGVGREIGPDGVNRGDVQMMTGVGEEGGLRGEVKDEGRKNSDSNAGANVNGTERPVAKVNGNGAGGPGVQGRVLVPAESEGQEEKGREDVEINVFPVDGEEQEIEWWGRPPGLRLGLSDKPGIVPTIYYGLQHYLSLAGSLIFIPIIMVPTMGGSDRDIATVISTMLFVSGITTIMYSLFGTRLPLVQGSSFVFLAPALAIINSRDYRNLTEHKFRHIMRELQGAIIVSSIFQSILGFSGLMSLLVRFLNPIVVAPTIASIGLAFFSFGFPQAGSCVEISVPLIALALLFSLHLRGISIFGHRLFQIYAVPFSVMGIWAYAFFLTAGGAYNYKGCNPDIPTSNILIDSCRKHSYTMKRCRTDASNAWETASWVGVPYPFQWGVPIFSSRTCIIMVIASLVASVDSVGTYHAASLLAVSKPPTRGIVSRGIALEGLCSLLAGLWGTGTGSTTLTENVYTISSTQVANRRVVQVGAIFLIFFSFIGKVGGILASIPQALAASILCFEWAVVVALGLLNLQHTRMSSFRNMIIVGVSLFLGFSIPSYFQQYQPTTSLMVPSYLVPFSAASDGPFSSGSQVDFAMNALLSLNMVVTFLVALVLDNTVPGDFPGYSFARDA